MATMGVELLTMRLVLAFADDAAAAAVVVVAVDVPDWRSCCEWSRISFASDWGTGEDGVGVNEIRPATEVFSATAITCELEDLVELGLMRLRLALLSFICLLLDIVREN